MTYVPHTDSERKAMLDAIGVAGLEDLFADIPAPLRFPRLDLPHATSELDVERELEALAARNVDVARRPCFLGAGSYLHYVPATVDAVLQRGELATAYTPYQPELSQGSLQATFEYQSMICRAHRDGRQHGQSLRRCDRTRRGRAAGTLRRPWPIAARSLVSSEPESAVSRGRWQPTCAAPMQQLESRRRVRRCRPSEALARFVRRRRRLRASCRARTTSDSSSRCPSVRPRHRTPKRRAPRSSVPDPSCARTAPARPAPRVRISWRRRGRPLVIARSRSEDPTSASSPSKQRAHAPDGWPARGRDPRCGRRARGYVLTLGTREQHIRREKRDEQHLYECGPDGAGRSGPSWRRSAESGHASRVARALLPPKSHYAAECRSPPSPGCALEPTGPRHAPSSRSSSSSFRLLRRAGQIAPSPKISVYWAGHDLAGSTRFRRTTQIC